MEISLRFPLRVSGRFSCWSGEKQWKGGRGRHVQCRRVPVTNEGFTQVTANQALRIPTLLYDVRVKVKLSSSIHVQDPNPTVWVQNVVAQHRRPCTEQRLASPKLLVESAQYLIFTVGDVPRRAFHAVIHFDFKSVSDNCMILDLFGCVSSLEKQRGVSTGGI